MSRPQRESPGAAAARGMSGLVSLLHRTSYRYDRPVALGPHEIRLQPAPASRTPVTCYSLSVRPAQHAMNWHYDAAGNRVARVLFPERIRLLEIEVGLTADLAPVNPFDFLVEPGAERYPFHYTDTERPDLAPFLAPAENGEQLQRWLAGIPASTPAGPRGTVEFLTQINRRLSREIAYVTRLEHGVQSCEDTLRLGRGSCRDSGWVLVQVLRHLGIAARFVSGYLIQLAGDKPDAPKTDSADLHAWCEAYLPGAGWIGFDPTSGLLAAEGHIPLARGSTPALAAPVTGTVEPCRTQMDFSMSVTRLP
jgi:transglutaminase-like putative cysteine protease